jgi:type II secretory pathway pseudopilin PulG
VEEEGLTPKNMLRNWKNQKYRKHVERGFSMVEVVVVTAIIFVVVATAIVSIAPSLRTSKSNAGMELVLGELRRAHERAIDERRIYRVTFVAPQTIQVDVGQVANIASTITGSAPVFVQAQPPVTLPRGVQFIALAGLPASAATTPDGFGAGVVAIDFDISNGGGGTQIFFQPDGRSLDAANRLNDGVLYLAEVTSVPPNASSSRAVTVFGSTGRAKGWTLANTAGAYRWTQ